MDPNRYIRIKDEPNFVRDKVTGALVNINQREIKQHRQLLEQKRKERQEIDQLKNDVADIKAMLQQLLQK